MGKNLKFTFIILACILFSVFIVSSVIAHTDESEVKTHDDPRKEAFEKLPDPVMFVKIVSLLLVLLTIPIIKVGQTLENQSKKIVFLLLVVPIMASTLYLGGYTVFENVISDTGGPIHWHADYQVWACGERLDLVDPRFPSNKIGSPLYHEHNDDRVHLEGTVMNFEDITLDKYFEVIGGDLHEGFLKFPTNDGVKEFNDGDSCSGGQGKLKVFVNGELLTDYTDYIYYPDPLVPPGDCFIVEFSPEDSSTTDKICESWSVNGWTYDNYKDKRRPQTVGDRQWQ